MTPVRFRPRFRVASPLLIAASSLGIALWAASPAYAVVPIPTYPNCGADGTGKDCPPDITREDGSLSGDNWAYVNFMPADIKKNIRKQEHELGAGSGSTVAWRRTTGRFDVKIAILDCGIRWHEEELTNKVAPNRGELPAPLGADGRACANYDCDGNGLFNVQDYADDDRVLATAGRDQADGELDASDLINAFADGLDNDGNGFVDDIAGWDFMWDDNDPYTNNDFYHMTSVLVEAAGEGGQQASDIGHCPNCSVLPVRISDSFVGEGDKIAAGIIYAVDQGANVIGMALGSMSNPSILQDAMQYAWDNGVTIVAAAGDELGYHHNYPGANDHAVYVHSIKYYPTISLETARTTLGFFGCNNFGARLDAVATSNACATGSVAATSGMAGLIYSRAKDLGLSLSAAEVRQLLLRNTDDIDVPESRLPGSAYFPSYPGWDQFFGYGRINSGKAVNAISAQTIPPEIDITNPRWFEYVDPRLNTKLTIAGELAARRASSYSYVVEWAPGVDPKDSDYETISSKNGLTSPTAGTLGVLDLAAIPPAKLDFRAPVEELDGGDTIEERGRKVNARSVTLRVKVTDSFGNKAEERKQFFLIEDPDLLPGFPIRLGYSGESSPVLYDLNKDGAKEIVIATSEGLVHAFTSRGTELSGWPVKVGVMPGLNSANPRNHTGAPAYASGDLSADVRQGIIGTAAVGDLENDGVADVVVGTVEGYVYAFSADGKLKSGFPVMRDPASDAQTSPKTWIDPGMFSSTVLYDLDRDGRLEIIQASMDQKIYVWRYNGARQSGWPVKIENPDGSTGVTTVAGRIVSSPAVGDIDGDGEADIVVGTNEYSDDQSFIGFAYAIDGDGNNNPGGPVKPGWPIGQIGLLSGVINYVGEGITVSPSLADVNGDGTLEILLSGVGSWPVIYQYDGKEFTSLGFRKKDFGKDSNVEDNDFFGLISNGAFADFDGGDDLEVMMGGSGIGYFISLGLSRYLKFDHMATAWKARSGKMLDAFPRVIEDIGFFNAPAAADVSGDGMPEMVVGSSGYILHAFSSSGDQPAGWPKFTGGWLLAGPAVGDIDGDGKNEVVVPTREGWLFAWNTSGFGGLEWPVLRHDPQNTGNYEHEGETVALAGDLDRVAVKGGSSESGSETMGCSTKGGPVGSSRAFGLGLSLGLALLVSRRRR